MKIVQQYDELKKLNFSDHKILSMSVDFLTKKILIRLDGVYLKINSDWKDLDNASMQISDWKMISISEYEPHRKIWKRYTENHFDILREICEMDLNNDLVLKGFGKKSGYWVEYKMTSPKITVQIGDERA